MPPLVQDLQKALPLGRIERYDAGKNPIFRGKVAGTITGPNGTLYYLTSLSEGDFVDSLTGDLYDVVGPFNRTQTPFNYLRVTEQINNLIGKSNNKIFISLNGLDVDEIKIVDDYINFFKTSPESPLSVSQRNRILTFQDVDVPSESSITRAPYLNKDTKADEDEYRVGTFLDFQAQSGKLAGVSRVTGAARIKGSKSGDYRFVDSSGYTRSADLKEPDTQNMRSFASNLSGKQAEIMVVRLGKGKSGLVTLDQAQSMAEGIVKTDGTGINRVIVIKGGVVIVDQSR